MNAKDKKIREDFNGKIEKMFDELAETPMQDVDANILRGIVRKRFKEDEEEHHVNFEELDPDRANRIKRSKKNLTN